MSSINAELMRMMRNPKDEKLSEEEIEEMKERVKELNSCKGMTAE